MHRAHRTAASRLAALALTATLLTGASLAQAAAATAAPASHSVPSPTQAPDHTVLARADALMSQTYREFAVSARKHEAPFDWSTDGCSPPTPTAWAAFFRGACVMHDFGYHNYGSPGPKGLRPLDPTENRRLATDNRFLEEMERICDDQPGSLLDCQGAAQTMYQAVRLFGGPAFHGPALGNMQ